MIRQLPQLEALFKNMMQEIIIYVKINELIYYLYYRICVNST
jgi:hypothetical protein